MMSHEKKYNYLFKPHDHLDRIRPELLFYELRCRMIAPRAAQLTHDVAYVIACIIQYPAGCIVP